ncbi:hypothetical protein H072_5936 [Dactylellina haptotyla CBS 200.50]|uniref:CHAT domain-containing protein n=1 Tax=Dactylellina haptotyla (strain CBS 200.50) TaxID=1284197 RepID=S8BY41_DACHA|nr:hypothetical protein H072_5936 [Dactylellina haptotyla CBS 200.50]
MKRQKLDEEAADGALEEFRKTNQFDKLEEALDILGDIIFETSEDDTEEVGRLSYKYAEGLLARFERGKHPSDIRNAINFANVSMENYPDLPNREKVLLLAKRRELLSQCLIIQEALLNDEDSEPDSELLAGFLQGCELADKSVDSLTELGIDGGPYIEAISHKAFCLRLRWEKDNRYPDLEECIKLSREVRSRMTEECEAETRIKALTNLAFYLQSAYGHRILKTPELEDIRTSKEADYKDEALRLVRLANEIYTERPTTKIETIMAYIENFKKFPKEHSRSMLGEIYELLRVGISALGDIMRTSLIFDQYDHVSQAYGVGRYAAAAALERNLDPFIALCLLEEGRNVAASVAADGYGNHEDPFGMPETVRQSYIQAKRELSSAIREKTDYKTRKDLLDEIKLFEARYKPAGEEADFASFAPKISRESIQKLGSTGPVILINITDIRSDAIVIQEDGVSSLHLPQLDEEAISRLSWEIQHRLAQEENPEELYAGLQNQLLEMLERLWRTVTKPILDYIGCLWRDDEIRNWPQVCWIPTGVLSLYPMHASGLGINKKGNVMNRVISTYAPSLKPLLRAQNNTACSGNNFPEVDGHGTAAILAMIDTIGAPPKPLTSDPENFPDPLPWQKLDFSNDEAQIVREFYPKPVDVERDIEWQPTTNRVIEVLKSSHHIIHISCHGYVDYSYPSQSLLAFSDWQSNPLTVEKLSDLKVQTRLIVLSACFSANSGVENLQDEMMHLTSAFYASGSSSVLGSLWQVEQDIARKFFSEFYGYLSGNSGKRSFVRLVAEACHFATLRVAEKTKGLGNDMKGAPREWAPFICVGHT